MAPALFFSFPGPEEAQDEKEPAADWGGAVGASLSKEEEKGAGVLPVPFPYRLVLTSPGAFNFEGAD